MKIGEAIHCGMTNINDFGVNYLVQVRALFQPGVSLDRCNGVAMRNKVVVNAGEAAGTRCSCNSFGMAFG